MDGELLIEFNPSYENHIGKKDGVQNIRLSNGAKNVGQWERYVILPAKIKQKYILGTTFTKPNKNDQFISIKRLLKYDERRQEQVIVVNGVYLAGIDVCEQRKFWITPINENTILLNDTNIKARTELKFEDYICIEYLTVFGKRVTRQQQRMKKDITFLFLPRQTNPDAFILSHWEAVFVEKFLKEDKRDKEKAEREEEMVQQVLKKKNDPNLIFTPGQNELILSNILSHLSLRHVKNVRFVSKSWAEEGAKQLRKRAWVHFNFENILSYPFDNDATIGMKLFRYDCDVKNSTSGFALSNIVLSLPRYDMNKLMMHLYWFFTQNHHRFKRIKLKIYVLQKRVLDSVVELLTIISPFMEEFNGEWTFYHDQDDFQCKFPSDDCFSKVKKVSVSVHGYRDVWNEFKTLISAMKMNNVKEIDIFSYKNLDLEYLDCFNSCNFEGKRISVNLTLFTEQLKFLLSSKFDKSLKKLIMKEPLDVKSVPIFQQVLFKHCKRLEVLSFTLPYIRDKWKLRFPIFEKLKVLNMDFYNYEDNMDKNDHVVFDNGTGNEIELDYNRHFSNLQSLTLCPHRRGFSANGKIDYKSERAGITKHWKDYYEFYKVFFPFLPSTYEQLEYQHKEEKLFKNLLCLNIQFEENCPQRMEMIARNFPNVHNKWLNKIRQKMTDKNNDNSKSISASSENLQK